MKKSPENCFHLTVEIVQEIHSEAIARFSGSEGLRETALLESAVAAPQASFAGKSPYEDLTEVAAAAYIICAEIIHLLMAISEQPSARALCFFA